MDYGVHFTIRLLRPADDVALLKTFSSGHANFQALKSFLQNDAAAFHEQSIAKTYLAVTIGPDDTGTLVETKGVPLLGYITLIASRIDIRNGYQLAGCDGVERYYENLPAIKIARLACNKNVRGQGIGQALVSLATALAATTIAETVGCRFIVTDSKPEAVDFYSKIGFTMLDTDDNRKSPTPVMFIDLLLQDESNEAAPEAAPVMVPELVPEAPPAAIAKPAQPVLDAEEE